LKGNVTVIHIAHRIHLLQGCDMILVMDDGKIVAQGNFKDLIHSNALLRNSYNP
jgi:ABC-type multidrug transport system fused ATPase/permease subunit